MWTVPFVALEYENIIRAFMDENGEVKHILEPEYHGDPVSDKGILCFTHFGWQMLDQVKQAGFDNAYAFLYSSEIYGYFGGEQVLFIAEKNSALLPIYQPGVPLQKRRKKKSIACFVIHPKLCPLVKERTLLPCSSCGITYLRTRPTQEKNV